MSAIVRIGLGYDLHRLIKGRKLILAGVPIAFEMGLVGHSDADVVLHAVIDALLGAAGLDDIGRQFPDTDPAYKNADSSELLAQTLKKVAAAGFTPVNVDATIIAERPKLADFQDAMRRHLAQIMNITPGAVAIKAKTNEGLGDIGAGLAIACHAVVSLGKTEP